MKRTLAIGMATVYGSKPLGADGRYVNPNARSGGEHSVTKPK